MRKTQNKIALVTGGSRGIGAAVSLALAEDGYDIWLNYRSGKENADKISSRIKQIGRNCELLQFDVADRKATEDALEPLLRDSVPSALINNAGFAKDALFGLMSGNSWDNVIEVILNGFYNVTHSVIPHMIRARYGRIISISSISGQAGNAGQVNYSAAKAGIIGASKALAKEIARRGITVNVVAPGLIDTDMAREAPARLIEQIPMRRMGTAQEVAGCVRFLCSDWATYITGQVIGVNGGLYT